MRDEEKEISMDQTMKDLDVRVNVWSLSRSGHGGPQVFMKTEYTNHRTVDQTV
jgi:hypothetical protein